MKIWAERIGTFQPAIVIGPTSEKAAKSQGFTIVHSPKEGSKGIEAWANTVRWYIENQFQERKTIN
jgi:uroporphyrinogen-III synthase